MTPKLPYVATVYFTIQCENERAAEEIVKHTFERMVELARKGNYILPREVLEIECYDVKRYKSL
jgi:hypothetical protein